MDGMVIEWAPFTLAAQVTESELLAASEDLQEGFLSRQPGFVRRELLRASADEWIDLVYWASDAAARRAMGQAAASPVCHRYFHLMVAADQGAGAGVRHFNLYRSYAAGTDAGVHAVGAR